MSKILTIAIIDDDEGVRASLSSLLRSLGYRVRGYSSALEFLDDKIGDDPSCMITDIQMPGMSGDELQMELMARGRIFPMIFMTAFPNDAMQTRVMSAGARAFLDKPVDADAIAGWLEVILNPPASD